MAHSQIFDFKVTNPTTGGEEQVFLKARDDSVLLEDGSTLRGWIDIANRALAKHTLALQQVGGGGSDTGLITSKDIEEMYISMGIDPVSGKLVAEKYNGRKTSIGVATKTAIDLVVSDGAGVNKGHKFLTILYDDNSRLSIDMNNFQSVYTGDRGENILVAVEPDNTITASLLDRSIGIEKLTLELQDKLTQQIELDDLPVAGHSLGLVKNGGNVEVQSDGTMNAANVKYAINDNITPPIGVELTLANNEAEESTNYVPRLYAVRRGVTSVTDADIKPICALDTSGTNVLRVSANNSDLDDSDTMTYTWYVKNIKTIGTGYTRLGNTTSRVLDGTKSIFELNESYDIYCVMQGSGLDRELYAAKPTNHVIVTITA